MSVLKMTLDNLMVRLQMENTEYSFFTIVPGPLWPGVVAPERGLSLGKIELFEI